MSDFRLKQRHVMIRAKKKAIERRDKFMVAGPSLLTFGVCTIITCILNKVIGA